jgi:2-amino-4-hydroxy-6-hydroxymethyldihydropteridine diphosphokinase
VRAITLLPETKILDASKIYETRPVGNDEQDLFLNAALSVDTNLSPGALLGACLGIEAALGRVRSDRNGPRVLDLDLLFYESVRMETHELTLPHPRVLERAFVMQPLLDLFPSGRVSGVFFAPKLREIGSRDISLYGETPVAV